MRCFTDGPSTSLTSRGGRTTLLFSVSDYEKLRKISHELSKAKGFHVSIAHLIREGAKSVIAFYEEEKK